MRAMGSVGTLFAIVSRLANATAQNEWKLYRSAASGKDEDRTEVTSHAALDIWRKPNRFFTGQEFVETFEQHVDLVGEGWWIVGRNPRMRSVPLELWPVRPDRMMPVPSAEGFLAGYIYLGPDGDQIPLQLDEVIQLRMPNPLDIYRGMGPVQSLLADLDSARYSAEWNRNFFVNGAGPGGILQVEKRLGDDEFAELTARWREQHQGVANAHRVAIVEQGQWVDSTYTMRDMQFAELRNVQREIIREAFGFPKPMLGTVDDSNRANMEAADVMFARWLIQPRLERIKQALNSDFLPLFGTTGKGVEFDYESPVPNDRTADSAELTAKTAAYQVLVNAGVEPDDAAEVCELPRMKIKIVEPLPAPVAPPALPPGQPEPAPNPTPPAPSARVRNADDPRLPESDLPDLTPVQASWVAALNELLAQWVNIAAEWVGSLITEIRDLVARGDRAGLAALAVPADLADDGDELLAAAMIRLAYEAAQQVVREAAGHGVDAEAGVPDESALRDIAKVITQSLAKETAVSAGREAIRQASPGETGDAEADRVADAVRRELEDDTDSRPRQWLGHALTQAQHTGRTATMRRTETSRSAPTVAYYGQEQNDKNTCRYCREIDGRWLGNTLDDALRDYPAGGYIRCEGGPRCRGMVAAVYRPQTTGGAA
jgi:HK97 family phage portal protein